MQHPVRGAVVAAAACSLLLAGCGFGGSNDSGGSSDSKTLNLLVPSYSDGTKSEWQGIIKDFEAKNAGIKVNLEVESWDNINDVIRTKVQSNQAPDILNIDAFSSYARDDLLYPVKDVLSADRIADFQDSLVKNASMNGTQYGMPIVASARALFINTDLATAAGVTTAPKTWDELKADATKVSKVTGKIGGQDAPFYGYGMPLGSEEAQGELGIWLFGNGGSYGDEKSLTVNSPQNIEAANYMKSMIDAKITEPNPGSVNRTPLINQFIQGKIGYIEALPPTIQQIEQKNPGLKYEVAPIPTKDGSPVTLGVADHMMAFKNKGDKQAEIKKFLDYFFTPDVYMSFVKAESFVPTTKSGAEQLASDKTIKPFLDLLPDAKFYPSTNQHWATAQGAIQQQIGEIGQGKDPKAVLDAIQAAGEQ